MSGLPIPANNSKCEEKRGFSYGGNYREFGGSMTSSGSVVVDVLPPLYTQADLGMMDCPEEENDTSNKMDSLKG